MSGGREGGFKSLKWEGDRRAVAAAFLPASHLPKKQKAFNDVQRMMRLSIAFTGACSSAPAGRRGGGRSGAAAWRGGRAAAVDSTFCGGLGGRAGGHPVHPALGLPRGHLDRGKHMQGTWPDLETKPDSHNHAHMLAHTRASHTHTYGTCGRRRSHERSLTRVFTHLRAAAPESDILGLWKLTRY